MDLDKAYHLIETKLLIWLRDFVRLLPNIVIASLVIVLGFFAAKAIKNLSQKLFHRFTQHETVSKLFSSFVYVLTIGVTLFIALSVLHLNKALMSILAGASIAGIALAFAFQDIAANFMAGILLSIRRPVSVGDLVKSNEVMGTVKDINMRETIIETFQGQIVFVPNKDIFQSSLENFTRSGKRRIDLNVGVSYGDDLEKVRTVALQAVKKMTVLDAEQPPRIFYNEFADSSINFTLQLWVNSTDQPVFWQGTSEAIMLVKKAFDENGISIPYPIRTLDFAIKGGESLSEVLNDHKQKKADQ
jgi:small-conductance mechanosensitive channel